MWIGCIDNELCWWCVRSRDEIWMVHQSMRNSSWVVDKLYIQRVLVAWDGFHYLCSLLILLYSKASYDCEISFDSCLALGFSIRISSGSCQFFGMTLLLPISPMFDIPRHSRMSPGTSHLILSMPTSLHRVSRLFRTIFCLILGLPNTESTVDTHLGQLRQ
jgi:hypothetical protein